MLSSPPYLAVKSIHQPALVYTFLNSASLGLHVHLLSLCLLPLRGPASSGSMTPFLSVTSANRPAVNISHFVITVSSPLIEAAYGRSLL